MNKRLFFAINLPAEIKEEIDRLYLKELEKENKKEKVIKIVKKENLHFTLRFIGYFPEEKLNELIENTEKIKFKEFQIKINGVRQFKNSIIWLSTSSGATDLQELSDKLSEVLHLQKEKITAHLTIARNKNMKKKEFNELIEKLKKIQLTEVFRVKSFSLMESQLKAEGPTYKVLHEFKAN